MTQHEVITQIRDAITTGDLAAAEKALEEYKNDNIENFFGWLSMFFYSEDGGSVLMSAKMLDFDHTKNQYQLFQNQNEKSLNKQ